jgi:hypothetical protein
MSDCIACSKLTFGVITPTVDCSIIKDCTGVLSSSSKALCCKIKIDWEFKDVVDSIAIKITLRNCDRTRLGEFIERCWRQVGRGAWDAKSAPA